MLLNPKRYQNLKIKNFFPIFFEYFKELLALSFDISQGVKIVYSLIRVKLIYDNWQNNVKSPHK